MSSQVISKKRVADYGEVLTAEREVNAMLDMVHHELVRTESRWQFSGTHIREEARNYKEALW